MHCAMGFIPTCLSCHLFCVDASSYESGRRLCPAYSVRVLTRSRPTPRPVLLAAGHERCVVMDSLHSVLAAEQDVKFWAGRQAPVMESLHVHNMRRCAGVPGMPKLP